MDFLHSYIIYGDIVDTPKKNYQAYTKVISHIILVIYYIKGIKWKQNIVKYIVLSRKKN